MSNFTTITLDINTGTLGGPTWTPLGGAGTELRWSDSPSQDGVASASWPSMARPAVTGIVSYTYAFTADAVGTGVIGNAGPPPAFSNANYLWARWSWDGVGTFGSNPIWDAYASVAHVAVVRGDGSQLGGHAVDTGATARSYLKCNAYGANTAIMPAAPAGGPANAPVVTDGATGALTYAGAATWLTNYQGLQGDNDYIQYGATPTATSAQVWYGIFASFTGPNETPGLWQAVMSLKYTWT